MDKLNLNVDYMKLLYEDKSVSIYELDAIHLGENPHGMSIDKDCVERSIDSFADKPLYCIIDNKWDILDSRNNDFLEHFREEYPDIVTRDRILPFGTVPESAIKDARYVERDGRTYLRMNVVVWKKLLPHVSEILQKRDGDVRVSVEFYIKESETNEETGIIEIKEFQITAITAIGEKFQEVMDGAGLKTIRFSYSDIKKDNEEKYCTFAMQKSYELPLDIVERIQIGIDMRERHGRGGTKAQYLLAKTICESRVVYESQLIDFVNYFSGLKSTPEESNPPTNKYIAYSMFGGKDLEDWLDLICNSEAETINSDLEGGNPVASEAKIEEIEKNSNVNIDVEIEKTEEEKEKEKEKEKEVVVEHSFVEEEWKEKFSVMEINYAQKCADFEEMAKKCAEVEEKLRVYESEKLIEENLGMIEEFAECLAEEEIEEFKEFAKCASKEDMKDKISSSVMAFAKNSVKKCADGLDYTVNSLNPYFSYKSTDKNAQPSDLEKIIAKSKTKVV